MDQFDVGLQSLKTNLSSTGLIYYAFYTFKN